MKNLVEELRTKKSRDNRELLDRAADRIEELEREKVQIFDDIDRLLFANQIGTVAGAYYRKELKDSLDILKKFYIAKDTNAPTNTEKETEKQSEWISVDEMLPEELYVPYLVAIQVGEEIKIDLGERIKCFNTRTMEHYEEWCLTTVNCGEITHWMPLPEAPKMKGGE